MNYDFLKIVLIKNRYPKDTCTTEYCNIQVRSMMPLFFSLPKKKRRTIGMHPPYLEITCNVKIAEMP